MRNIELLSPAKDLTCGMEAIRHGADAVYIGAPKFGARAAAGNTLDDIRSLCEFAHLYDVRIYVALNTLLKEEELAESERLIWQLYQAGADALIVQDMGITQLSLPPIPLHASTQTDNRTPEKVKFLEASGFTQVVLARELSLEEIRAIRRQTTVPLEVFVHGALCVSYSGQCYLSAALSGRSANRGECAQYCRLPYTMQDAEGKIILSNKHLLSLKDMNRSDQLEALLDAGVSSLKIEGRLKEVAYVKNVTAYYRQKLDALFRRRPEYRRASSGTSTFAFEPVLEKSFNRGFTPFFLKGRASDITAFDTPKSLGEKVGMVKEIKGNSFTLAGTCSLHNGDGLAFFNTEGELEGFRVNRVEANRVFPLTMPAIRPKMLVYRNFDQSFDKLLSKPSAERKLAVFMEFAENAFGFTLEIEDETGARVCITEPFVKEPAHRNQEENIRMQLAKLGNTLFEAASIRISFTDNWFVPSSLLTEMRRWAVERLLDVRKMRYKREWVRSSAWGRNFSSSGTAISPSVVGTNTASGISSVGAVSASAAHVCPSLPFVPSIPYPETQLTYLGNVANSKAEAFYKGHGVKSISPAFELKPLSGVPLMFTKHCLRYSQGWCPVYQKQKSPYKEPYFLVYKDTRLRLHFDCKECRMLVVKEE